MTIVDHSGNRVLEFECDCFQSRWELPPDMWRHCFGGWISKTHPARGQIVDFKLGAALTLELDTLVNVDFYVR